MGPDTCLEEARYLLHHRRRLLLAVTFGRHRYLFMDMHAPVITLEPQDHGHQRRAGLHGERITSLDSARSSPPGAWLPITRRRLPSSTCTPGPWRRQARSAANLNPRWAHDSGRRHTPDQPRPYPASVSLSLSPGTGHLLKRTPGRPVRPRDRLGNGNSRSQAIAGFPAPALLRANPRQGQVPVAGGPRRSRVRDRRTPQDRLLNRCPGDVTRRWSGARRSRRRPPCCRSRPVPRPKADRHRLPDQRIPPGCMTWTTFSARTPCSSSRSAMSSWA